MTTIRVFGLLGLAWLYAAPVAGQEVLIGSVPVRLGESRAAVLKKLGAEYRLDSTSTPRRTDQWFVWTRGGPPFRVAAMVGFTRGRLWFLSRGWDPATPTEGDVMRTVVRALSQLVDRPGQSCEVVASHSSEPDADTELVTVTCGGHSVTISVGSVGADLSSGINETWRLGRR